MRRSYHVKTPIKGPSVIRDAYGFEVKQKLAGLYSEHSATWSAEEKRRTDKWLQFLKDISPPEHQKKDVIFAGFWDTVLEKRLKEVIIEHKGTVGGTDLGERLDGLVRLGVPAFLRGNVWGLFLGHDSERTPGLFKLLSQKAAATLPTPPISTTVEDLPSKKTTLRTFSTANEETCAYSTPSFFHCEQTLEQINKDLNRTFPGHPLMDESGREALREILVAFSFHSPDIGYCQGMNFITGLLLLFHQPEDAFWNLVSIIEHLLPNQFDRDMLPAVVDKLVFTHLVKEYFPQLSAHLDEMAVDASYLCPHWFLCCFVNALPMETCLRVWDVLFWERQPNILFKVALALVEFSSQDLMETQNAATAWEQLQNMAASFFNSSRLIETVCLNFDAVDEERIAELRSCYLNRIKEQSIKDLLGKRGHLGVDDASATTTPTKILAASASLVRGGNGFSSSACFASSTAGGKGTSESIGCLQNEANHRAVREVVARIRDDDEHVSDILVTKIHDLIDRLIETETESRDAKTRLELSRKEIAKANETNRSLKSRLGAVYTDLDKKNEYLDCMIAKCQVLTEKVAAQEEVICKQRRYMFKSDAVSRLDSRDLCQGGMAIECGVEEASDASTVGTGEKTGLFEKISLERGTQSLKNLFSLRR